MAHYAEVIDGIVHRVVVVSNDVTYVDGVEDEQRGIDLLDGILPTGGEWVQTSYNGSFRYNYAGVDDVWDADAGAFHRPRLYDSWSLDTDFLWQPPTPRPDDGKFYVWDEDTTSWVVVE